MKNTTKEKAKGLGTMVQVAKHLRPYTTKKEKKKLKSCF
jgi:hypothetical protein